LEPPAKQDHATRDPYPRAEKTVKHEGYSSGTLVSLRALKRFALEILPKDSPLRDVLLVEDDEIPTSEMVGKAKIWLALLRREGRVQ